MIADLQADDDHSVELDGLMVFDWQECYKRNESKAKNKEFLPSGSKARSTSERKEKNEHICA